MAKNALVKLFEAGDGRSVSSEVLFVKSDEQVTLATQGWCDIDDPDECQDIVVYKFLHYPNNPRCEDAILIKWTQDVQVDPLCTKEVPRIRLTKNNVHDIINERGQYLLVRECGAEDVNVYAKYEEKV